MATVGIVPLLFLATVACAAASGFQRVVRVRLPSQVLAILALFILWAAVSALWAPNAWLAGQAAFKVAGLCVVGVLLIGAFPLLEADERTLVERALVIGWTLGLAILTAGYLYASLTGRALWGQYVGDPLTTLSRGQVVLMMLAWPVCAALWAKGRRLSVAAVVLVSASLMASLRSHSALIGLISGIVVFGAVSLFQRRGLIAVATGIALFSVAAPVFVNLLPSGDTLFRKVGFVVPSAVHRAYTWHFTVDRILEHPLRGWGMEASRRVPGGDAIIILDTKDRRDPLAVPGQEPPGQSMMKRSEYMPLHPHNIPLQIWLELGVPGVALMVWLILVAFLAPIRNRDVGLSDAFRAGTATSYIAVGSLSFGAWQNWWIALGWLTAALMSMVTVERAESRESTPLRSA